MMPHADRYWTRAAGRATLLGMRVQAAPTASPLRYGGRSFTPEDLETTTGRGRNDREKRGGAPVRDIGLLPLYPGFRSLLTDGRMESPTRRRSS